MRGSAWLAPTPPTVAIEIASRRVTVVGVEGSQSKLAVTGQASEALPDGAVVPALSGANIRQPEAVVDALGRAIERAGLSAVRRAALIVPDSVARVSLLAFDQIPARSDELDKLIRWQLRKSMPFPIDDAQISHFPASTAGTSATIAAVVVRRDVVTEYEAVTAALGIHAGVVDLASFNVMNAIAGGSGAEAVDWMLVHRASEATTLAILRGTQLMFYRHRTAVDEEPLGALVHQTAMYHEDRLGGGAFARAWLSGGGAETDAIRAEIAARLRVAVETVDIEAAATFRERVGPSADLADALAASVGILMRDRAA